ncbi:MAG: AAA family ATPase [Thermodesulfobacteriota bacterium]|nr:AAA family ATPase [Thermodesulfobacteriota bacterium]
MYEKFYGLSEKPFHIVPNPNFLYLSPKHQNALTYLEYGIRERMGFILLTGEIGTGKTTLIRYILDQIETDIEVAVIFNTNVSPNQLLGLILREFELEADKNDKAGNLDSIHHFLIRKYARHQRVLLIIDEAQNLSEEALEEVRMLSNLQADDDLLLQIMLVGQPELKAKLRRLDLAQLTQRIAVTYHLMPLSREETGVYIASRLEKTGGRPDLFTQGAVDEIFRASNGTPRSINLLCDTALVYGFADELHTIDAHVVTRVVEDKGDIGWTSKPVTSVKVSRGQGEIPETGLAVLQHRFTGLEERVQELKHLVDRQLEEFAGRAEGSKDELVSQLSRQLEQEREKNEKLLVEHGRIKERVEFLEERNILLTAAMPDSPETSISSSTNKKKKTSWFPFRF